MAATMYVTPAGATTKTGATWATAMSIVEFEADVEGSAEAGDIYYVAGGTYTFTGDILTALDGVAPDYISVIGVASGTSNEPPVYLDWAYNDDRPLFSVGEYTFQVDDLWKIFNIRAEGTDSWLLRADGFAIVYNCKATNTSEAGGDHGFYGGGSYARFINCEGISTNGSAFVLSSFSTVIYCYAHDSASGFKFTADCCSALFCIADTCSTLGISLEDEFYHNLINNTVYNCGVGISNITITSYGCIVINNIINDCTTGISWNASTEGNFFMNNNLEGNGTEWTNPPVGIGVDHEKTTVDPQFTGANDFSLGSGSGCIDAGMSIVLGVG